MADPNNDDAAESHFAEAPDAPAVPNAPPAFDPNQMMQLFGTFLQSMGVQAQGSSAGRPDKTIDQFQRMHPPHFSGGVDPIAAEDWLDQMTTIFDGMMCPEMRRVSLVVLVLEGSAKHWWQGELRTKFPGKTNFEVSWKDFCKSFRDWYIPQSAREKMREELFRLYQRNMTVTEYEQRFSELARYAPDMVTSEEQKCFMFRKGLRDSIRGNLIGFRFKDFSELVETAKSAEMEQQSMDFRKEAIKRRKGIEIRGPPGKRGGWGSGGPSQSSRSSASSKSFQRDFPRCNNCGKLHRGECMAPPARSEIRCYTCNELGHISKVCPRNTGASSSVTGPQGRGRGGGRSVGGPVASGQGSTSYAPAGRGRGRGQGEEGSAAAGGQPRVFTITRQEAIKSPDVISVNDPFVMKAWAKTYTDNKHLKFLADGSAKYTKALGLELDLTEKGLGVRSRRYAILVDDLRVKVANIEDGGAFTVSGAEEILKAL